MNPSTPPDSPWLASRRQTLFAAAAAGIAGFGALAGAAQAADNSGPGLALPVEGMLPELSGATGWLNSPPLTRESLRGKAVLVDVWTYGCYNCTNAMPYVRGWAEKYVPQGLVVLGVHSPEFDHEKRAASVQSAADRLGVTFPIALDNDFKIWNALSNRFWPSLYFVDAQGRIRHHHYGEGDYERSERVIRDLLADARASAPAKRPNAG